MDDNRVNRITELLNEREYEAAMNYDDDARKNKDFHAAVAELKRIDKDQRTLYGLCQRYEFINSQKTTFDQAFASQMAVARSQAISKLK